MTTTLPKLQFTPPHGGRPGASAVPKSALWYFNPRPPCGGRPLSQLRRPDTKAFQSTPPVWGGDLPGAHPPVRQGISIHAPRVGGDRRATGPGRWSVPISIHAPRVGGDQALFNALQLRGDFNPRPPCGGRRPGTPPKSTPGYFNPRPPCGGRLFGLR